MHPKIPSNGICLLLFSSPREATGSLKELFTSCNFEVEDFDPCNGSQLDLTDDAIWDPLLKKVEAGEFQAIFSSPPCGTFSRVRSVPGGPPPLRGPTGSERYGYTGLQKHAAETVRLHNLLAVRTAKVFKIMMSLDRPAVVEQPAVRDVEVSMLRLDEFESIWQHTHTTHDWGTMCIWSPCCHKYIMAHASGVLRRHGRECTHPMRNRYEEGSVRLVHRAHPPAQGTKKVSDTLEAAAHAARGDGHFCIKLLAYYPPLLNKFTALKLRLAIARTCRKTPQS